MTCSDDVLKYSEKRAAGATRYAFPRWSVGTRKINLDKALASFRN